MTPNNLSREKCRIFAKQSGMKKHPNRNEVYFLGKAYAYVYAPGQKPFCRQFYDNQEGVIFDNGVLAALYDRDEFKVGNVTRIAADGSKARDAKLKKEYA